MAGAGAAAVGVSGWAGAETTVGGGAIAGAADEVTGGGGAGDDVTVVAVRVSEGSTADDMGSAAVIDAVLAMAGAVTADAELDGDDVVVE